MTGGPGMGGDSFTNFSTGRAGQRRTSDDPPVDEVRPSQLGGIGTPSLVIGIVVVLTALAVLILSAL